MKQKHFPLTNNPERAGEKAAPSEIVGDFHRYVIYPVHTRFESVQWFVEDAETPDKKTGRPSIIRQEDSREAALEGLEV